MIRKLIASLFSPRPRPNKKLYIEANHAARKRALLMDAALFLSSVKETSTSVQAAGFLTLAWRNLRGIDSRSHDLVYCALKTNELLIAVEGMTGPGVGRDVVEATRSLARQIESVTFVTPQEVETRLAA